jgi:hypothetical protein
LNKIKKLLLGKPFKILAGILLTYLAFAYFAVNPLAKRILPWVAENKLASHLTVDQVKFDPLRLILTVNNLRLTRLDGAPLAGFNRLYLNMETSGLLHFAWRLKDIRLTAPQVTLDIAPDGKLNWADLIFKLNEDKQEDSGMARVLIDRILIEQGNIQYAERNHDSPFKVVLQPLGLELDGLSTLPKDRGDYLIVAKLPEQGGTLKWKGDLALNPLASSGKVDVQGVKLAKLMQVLEQHSLPINIKQGELETSFAYTFAMVKNGPELKPQAQLKNIALKLNQVTGTLASNKGRSEVGMQQLNVTLPQLDFSKQQNTELNFRGLNVVSQQISITRDKVDLFKLGELDVKAVDFDLASNQLKVAEILLKDGVVKGKRNQSRAVDWVQLLEGLRTTEQSPIKQNVEAKKPFSFDVANVELQHWQAHYQDQLLTHPLSVTVKDINTGLTVSGLDGAVEIKQLNSQISGVLLQSSLYPKPVARLTKISLGNGSVDLASSAIKIGSVVFSGLQTQVLRAADKSLNWQDIFKEHNAGKVAMKHQPDNKANQANNWKWSLERMALENASVHIEDKTTSTPVLLDIQNAMLELRNTTQALAKPALLKAKFQVKQGGMFDANGKIAMLPMKADVQFKLDKLALKPFAPYINQIALLKLNDGAANVYGKLAVKSDKSLNGQFQGGFSINNLAISEEGADATFLAWKSVSSDTLKLAIAPNHLHMDELHLEQPVGKFIIYEDKTLNIKRILRAPQPAEPAQAASLQTTPVQLATSSVVETTSQETFPIAVERLSINNADLEFADLSLKPQFGTQIHSLTGVINGLSTSPSTLAQVELDGKVDEFGSARIRGSVQPFKATEFTDLKLEFHNLEMNRLTPYSGKFAGRRIDSGKLSVDLEYKIKQHQLTGENKFVINKLRLGERVDSADATSLPLDLAIAILEDSDGVIDLDLPVSGSLDDPQFSYGKIVWKAIVNVLGKIVTAPFRALGKLFGMSSDKLEAIVFDVGVSKLSPQEQEKLKSIANVMSKRPSLTLNMTPSFDPASDKAALQEQAIRRDVLNEMGLKLKVGEQPGPVDLNNTKVQSALEVLLKERTGGGRSLKVVENLKNYFKKSKPEDLPKYSAMLQQLEQMVAVPDTDLISLANARAKAVQSYLVENASMDAKHISIAEAVKITGDGKTVNLKMDLGVAKK